MPFCFGMGEAVGTAAALSLKDGVLPKKEVKGISILKKGG